MVCLAFRFFLIYIYYALPIFLKLVLVANVIAFPIALWATNKWLQEYAYHINIAWWVFALAGVLAIVIALVTVSYQAIKTALANPVKSLRTE